jgi:hypothetical protein
MSDLIMAVNLGRFKCVVCLDRSLTMCCFDRPWKFLDRSRA